MNARIAMLAFVPAIASAAGTSPGFELRGKPQAVAIFPSPAKSKGTVLFLPGDGGWRGVAVTFAQTIAASGYDTYGFDTKRYLEGFSEGPQPLTADQMGRDVRDLISWVSARSHGRVMLLGWSQGAGMAILAAANAPVPELSGIVTMGLPTSAVLAWNWKDMFASAAHIEPDEPHFAIQPLLAKLSGTPLWMVHGSEDEYTSVATADLMFQAAQAPKRLIKVTGANHRFDTRRTELFQALQDGFLWVDHNAKVASAAARP
ncbi:MAG: AcvB/VirJ family lysyl-phosphatidylglycerol hydrolase [Acidobacteriota bacterium]